MPTSGLRNKSDLRESLKTNPLGGFDPISLREIGSVTNVASYQTSSRITQAPAIRITAAPTHIRPGGAKPKNTNPSPTFNGNFR